MNVFFVGVGEDAFLSRMASRFHDQGGKIAGLLCGCTPKPEFPVKATPLIIDARLLYQPETVSKAFNDIQPAILTPEILRNFYQAEREIFTLIDRYSYFTKPIRKTKILLRELVRYTIGFLQNVTNLDAIFFSTTPHSPADVVFYHSAKYLKIPTLQISRTLIPDRVLMLTSYRDCNMLQPRRDLGDIELENTVGAELLSILDKQSAWIDLAIKRRLSAEHGEKSWVPVLKFLIRNAKLLLGKPYESRIFSPFAASQPRFPHASIYIESIRQILKAKRLRLQYEKLAKNPNLEKPFIYLALHSQPERSTQPEGDIFEDQFLAASILAHALPKGWLLYIKEHPKQTQVVPPDLRQTHARTQWDYERFAELPNTILVPQRTPGRILIEKAKATATITGSAGWESMLHGRPSIIFGIAWYVGCDSCHKISSIDEARQAFSLIEASSQSQVRTHVLQFVAGIKPKLVHATTLDVLAKKSSNYDLMVDNLAKTLIERVKHLAFTPQVDEYETQ